MYNLISKENTHFEVEPNVAFMSNVLKTAFQESEEKDYPLMNVSNSSLENLLELCKHHQIEPINKIAKPIPDDKSTKEVFGEWYDTFLDSLSKEELFDVIMAANYMDIPIIMDLCCAKVACMLRGKDTQEIKDYLNIEHT